jgi:hypothetical protein
MGEDSTRRRQFSSESRNPPVGSCWADGVRLAFGIVYARQLQEWVHGVSII